MAQATRLACWAGSAESGVGPLAGERETPCKEAGHGETLGHALLGRMTGKGEEKKFLFIFLNINFQIQIQFKFKSF